MPFNTNITPGRAPILWSEVNEAFTKVNENFDILVATIGGGSGLTPIDFTSLDTDVTPTTDNLRSLGDTTHRWQSVFTSEHTTAKPLNGVWAGDAQIKGVGYTINLPANSTVGGDPLTGIGAELIIDPDKTFFKEIQVNNDLSLVATTFGDTVNFLSGSGVGLAVSSGADSITFSNTGILSVAAGLGITTATASGVATVTNAGVRSLQSTTALPSGRTTGAGINITGSVGDNLRITNAGVISISSGVGITVSADAATGDVTITNSAPAVNAFTQIQVDGDTVNRLQADAVSDVLNINGGPGITLSKTVGTDTLTIAVNPVFDLKGSVFGDDSSVIVNAIDRVVTAAGGFIGNLTGNAATATTANTSVALDITNTNGLTTVYYPTFVENRTTSQTVRADADLSYRTDTNTLTVTNIAGNLTGSVTGNIFTNLIDSSDSSAITVTPATIFSSDITVENNLTVRSSLILEKRLALAELEGINEELNIYSNWVKDTGISIYSETGVESVTLTSNRIVGVVTGVGPTQKEWVFDTNGQIQFPDTRYQTGAAISIAELKVLVAAAGSYAAFQSAIAALA